MYYVDYSDLYNAYTIIYMKWGNEESIPQQQQQHQWQRRKKKMNLPNLFNYKYFFCE